MLLNCRIKLTNIYVVVKNPVSKVYMYINGKLFENKLEVHNSSAVKIIMINFIILLRYQN